MNFLLIQLTNKLGIDKVMHNVQLKKHKSCKISIIEDNFKIPIDYIFSNHIQNISNKYSSLCTNNNKFIADSGYLTKFKFC